MAVRQKMLYLTNNKALITLCILIRHTKKCLENEVTSLHDLLENNARKAFYLFYNIVYSTVQVQ